MFRKLLVFSGLLVILASTVDAQSDNSLWAEQFAPCGVSGTVKALKTWGDTLVVAGDLDGLRITSAISPGIIFYDLNSRSWKFQDGDQMGLDSDVRAAAVLPNGDLVVGGDFSFTSGGYTLENIAVYSRDGTWSTLSGAATDSCDGPVNALLVFDGRLFIGGEFFDIGGAAISESRSLFAIWDELAGFSGTTDPIGFALGPGEIPAVNALVAVSGGLDDYIYLGGTFTAFTGGPGDTLGNLARVSVNTRNVSYLTGLGTNGTIYALEQPLNSTYENELYIGGDFTVAGDSAANNCAMYHIADETWHPLGDGFDGPVYAIKQYGSFFDPLLFAGVIDTTGSATTGAIRRWNFSGDNWLSGTMSSDGPIYALEQITTFNMAAGGDFEFVGDSSLFYGVFEFDDPPSTNDSSLYALGDALEHYDNAFERANDVAVDDEGSFYVIGGFTHAGGALANHIAKWDGVQWHALGQGLATAGPSLAVNGDTVYAARLFGSGAHEILMWDGLQWAAISPELPVTDINEMAVDTLGHLYVAGRNLDTIGLNGDRGLIKWDGTQWTGVGDSMIAISGTAEVNDIYIDSLTNEVYVCGRFDRIGGDFVNNVAYWDGQVWHGLGNSKTGDGLPRVIERSPQGGIVITGALERPEFVQLFQDTLWTSYAGGIATTIATDLLTVGCDLYISGDPLQAVGTEADPVSVNGVARWNGTEWDSLGSAVNGDVFGLASYGQQLAVTGNFTRAGGNFCRAFAIWNGAIPAGGGGDLQLLSPVANDTLEYGTVFEFTWDDTLTSAEEVSIEVSLDSGATWQIIHNKQDARFGRLPWVVPDTNAPYCMVRYSNADALCGAVVAPFTFAITADPDLESWWLTHSAGTYYDEPFLPGYTGFSFVNSRPTMWPDSVWKNIDYSGFSDPPDTIENFPDWFSYCEAFGDDWCFRNGNPDRPRSKAIKHWQGILRRWGGSCLGFSKAALVWLYGNEFNTNLIIPYEPLFYLGYTPLTRDAANKHWIYQNGEKHVEHNVEASATLTPYETMVLIRDNFTADFARSLSFTYRNWRNKFDKDSVLVDSVWRTSGHNVVPYNIRNVPDSQGIYYIYYYDSNSPTSQSRWMRIDSVNNTWVGSNYQTRDTTSRFIARLPINEYFGLATDDRKTSGLRPRPSSPYIQVFTSATEEIIISDSAGNQIGWANNEEVVSGLSGGPVLPDDPDYQYDYPGSYLVPKGDYRVTLSNFEGAGTRFTWFDDSVTYFYNRDSTLITQTDNLVIGEGLSLMNYSDLKENITLGAIQTNATTERFVQLAGMTFSPIDSMEIKFDSSGAIIIWNTGIAKSYNLLLWNSDAGMAEDEIKQTPGNVLIPSNATQKIVPPWGNLNSEQTVLLSDEDQNGDFEDTTVIAIATDIGDDDAAKLPNSYGLSQNYPNPFNPVTTINFDLPKAEVVRLEVLNILGKVVTVLVDERKSAGSHEVVWDGTNSRGESVSTGIYFYRMTVDGFSASRKMLLLK